MYFISRNPLSFQSWCANKNMMVYGLWERRRRCPFFHCSSCCVRPNFIHELNLAWLVFKSHFTFCRKTWLRKWLRKPILLTIVCSLHTLRPKNSLLTVYWYVCISQNWEILFWSTTTLVSKMAFLLNGILVFLYLLWQTINFGQNGSGAVQKMFAQISLKFPQTHKTSKQFRLPG